MVPHDSALQGRDRGLGIRSARRDDQLGRFDVLRATAPLADALAEGEIRARAAAFGEVPTSILAPVRRIERVDHAIEVETGPLDGVRVSTLLNQLARGTLAISDDAVVELIARVVRVVAALHAQGATFAHGAIAPQQVLLIKNGALLTDGVFGAALARLQWSRERSWKAFGIALPPSAGVQRFDQRSDVAQLGAVALAIALRRLLGEDEYPRDVTQLIALATERMARGPALQTWFEQAMQLHPRESFDSAVDADRAFMALLQPQADRRQAADVGHRVAS